VVFQSLENARLGGEMHDDLGLEGLDRRDQGGIVFEHDGRAAKVLMSLQDRVAAALELNIVVGREAINAEHGVPVGKKASRKVETNEASRTGHENPQTRRDFRPVHGVRPYHPKPVTV